MIKCGNKNNFQFSVPGLVIREVPGLVITVSELHIMKREPEGSDPEKETKRRKLSGEAW